MYESMDNILVHWEKGGKYHHSKLSHEQWNVFSPFALSLDDMLNKEVLVVLRDLSRLMAEKFWEPISHVCGWFNSWIIIAAPRSYFRRIQVARLSSTLQYREPYWDLGLGLGLTQ